MIFLLQITQRFSVDIAKVFTNSNYNYSSCQMNLKMDHFHHCLSVSKFTPELSSSMVHYT